MTQYNRLDFSRLPGYECFCKIESWPNASCVCGGIRKNENAESTTDPAAAKESPKKETRTIKIQTKPNPVMKKQFCKFCYNRRRPSSEFKSHFTKSGPEFGAKIVCPLLLQQQCARCGEIGHTPARCKSEHYLRDAENYPANPQSYMFSLSTLEHPEIWQHPIPPALQARHAEWEEQNVKTSRAWIIMSGDHSRYTNDFSLCYGGPNWVSFSEKPKTAYEQLVEMKYIWMRSHFRTEAQIEKATSLWFSKMQTRPKLVDFITEASGRLNEAERYDSPDISHYKAAEAEVIAAAERTNKVAAIVSKSMVSSGGGAGGSGSGQDITQEDIRAIIRKYVVKAPTRTIADA